MEKNMIVSGKEINQMEGLYVKGIMETKLKINLMI